MDFCQKCIRSVFPIVFGGICQVEGRIVDSRSKSVVRLGIHELRSPAEEDHSYKSGASSHSCKSPTSGIVDRVSWDPGQIVNSRPRSG